MRLVLASASPRRAELLRAAGFHFDVSPVDLDERMTPDEPPRDYVVRLATQKAQAVAAKVDDAVVLGADTTVVVRHEILGKPRDTRDAARMIRLLAGRMHEVFTGVAVIGGGSTRTAVEVSRVKFAPLSDEEIEWYAASGEPLDKAGAYAVQGLASRFIQDIEGSYSNVVGLPVATVYRLLRECGCDILTI